MSSALTKGCLTFDERPSTPPEVRKYRRSNNLEPGKRFEHYGMADDYKVMDLGSKIYGKTDKEIPTSAHDLISHKKPSELQRMNMTKAEMKYKTNKREPLGRGPENNWVLPSKFTEGGEAFGEKSANSDEMAKDLIFPRGVMDDGSKDEIYKRSHGSYGVGEQMVRGYKLGFDPKEKCFGKRGDTIAFNGVSANIQDVLQGDLKSNPTMVSRVEEENFRNTKDILGRSRNLGQDSANRPFEMVYGKSLRSQTSTAGEVIKGRYKEEDTKPDKDLGKSITPGFRNLSIEERSYGCPSIRSDIPCLPPHRRSLADSQNYGDDVPAQDLINPPAFSDLSIGPFVMEELKSKEKLGELFARIGYQIDNETLDFVFAQAAQGRSETSINSFRQALNAYIIESGLY